ncbi:DMT family transporter [Chlamydia psittaci]|uniref:DMT family transporter n=1 Tax=Chlamydia psittaci TaxID=83554 RepID=UPI0001F367AB|nr:DMT family transporter [Chlamydia psittaci]EPJ16192.1 triose-phosphate Transporter family protein [Chlamydia psittaci 02DC18]EPJ17309.1 triose-phosphate Transporter family protein [Chlamydia psittaci 02DC22]EPJ19177.1 triose-phosphate Transporter family protein [Chlamydia psittaci 03DC29]EPJ19623.1 triose-phosphate Transporter family protein [Chlamydia psittaci 02DC23]EPJ20728.1 triose-phosphate Transporter family protein [Chlamydia psittaci 02DC21]EPJ99977.1 triose-phosphate Transporter f
MSIFLVFFNAFIWSSSFAFSKLAMEASAPLFVTGSRMLIAGLVLVGIVLWKKGSLKLPKQAYVPVLILSIVGFYLTNVCEFLGLQNLSSSKACFIYGLSPFISALFSYIQLRETVTLKKLGGLSLGLFGYLSYLFFGGSDTSTWSWQLGIPEILLLLATCFSAFGWTLLRKIEKNSSLSVMAINAYAMLVSGVLSLGHSMVVETWNPIPVSNGILFAQAIFFLILFSNLISYNLYARLLRKYSSTFLSFCNLVMPLFSAFYGWVLLGESLSGALLLAVVFMVVGCRLIYHEEFRQGYIVS